jgi:hypothetical protein
VGRLVSLAGFAAENESGYDVTEVSQRRVV